MHNDISEILFTEKQLADRVGEIGAAITRDYADAADEGIILISVLRGAAIFMADLARKIELPLEMDYMAISSYGNGAKSSGVVRILKDLSSQIEGRHVIVAEDILRLRSYPDVLAEKPCSSRSTGFHRGSHASSEEDACAGEDRLQIYRFRVPR